MSPTAATRMKRPRAWGEARPAARGADALPVEHARGEIVRAVCAHDVVVIVAETGSGKTTQVPQFLVDACGGQRVVVTQPRRVAAISVATRVADERGADLGGDVGYTVRFDNVSSGPATRIRYVTDGVLLREALMERPFAAYSHVVVDEVHERSVNTDVLLGVLRRVVARGGLKVVLMSATTDAEKLRDFFGGEGSLRVAVLRLPGRLHPVDTFYTAAPVRDFVDASVTAALQVHVDYPMDGDVLAFLPGHEEIASAISLLRERADRHLEPASRAALLALPLHASLPQADQFRAIADVPAALRARRRKVVFATNVAETSVTIPGVKYVVDAGVAKVRSILSSNGVCADVLRLEAISAAQADQRAGRAGRTGPGYVFRLYTERQFDDMPPFPVPEVLRVDSATTTLQIMAHDALCGGSGLLSFPRLDAPPRKVLSRALETLLSLGALSPDMQLTAVGRLISAMPVTPMLARALLEAVKLGCVSDVVGLAAMLSVEGAVFVSTPAQRDAARSAQRVFFHRSGDHVTLVNVFRAFRAVKGHGPRTRFCKDHFVNMRTLASAEQIADQLERIVDRQDVRDVAASLPGGDAAADADAEERILRCAVAGFFRNAAYRRQDNGKYSLFVGRLGSRGQAEVDLDIHPASVFGRGGGRGKGPALLLFNELVLTSKPYLRTVSVVEQDWLAEHSGDFYKENM